MTLAKRDSRSVVLVVAALVVLVAVGMVCFWWLTDDAPLSAGKRDFEDAGGAVAEGRDVGDRTEDAHKRGHSTPRRARTVGETGDESEGELGADPPGQPEVVKEIRFELPVVITVGGVPLDRASSLAGNEQLPRNVLPGNGESDWGLSMHPPEGGEGERWRAVSVARVRRGYSFDYAELVYVGARGVDGSWLSGSVLWWLSLLPGSESLVKPTSRPDGAPGLDWTAVLSIETPDHAPIVEGARSHTFGAPRVVKQEEGVVTVRFAELTLTLEEIAGEGVIGVGRLVAPGDRRAVVLPFGRVTVPLHGHRHRGDTYARLQFASDGRFWFLFEADERQYIEPNLVELEERRPEALLHPPFWIGPGPVWDEGDAPVGFRLPVPTRSGSVLDFGEVEYPNDTVELLVDRSTTAWPTTGPTPDVGVNVGFYQYGSSDSHDSRFRGTIPAPSEGSVTPFPIFGWESSDASIVIAACVEGTPDFNFIAPDNPRLAAPGVTRHRLTLRPAWGGTRLLRVRYQGEDLPKARFVDTGAYLDGETGKLVPFEENSVFGYFQTEWVNWFPVKDLPLTIPATLSSDSPQGRWFWAIVPGYAVSATLVKPDHQGDVIIELTQRTVEVKLVVEWEPLPPAIEAQVRAAAARGQPNTILVEIGQYGNAKHANYHRTQHTLTVGERWVITRNLHPTLRFEFRLSIEGEQYLPMVLSNVNYESIEIEPPFVDGTSILLATIPAPNFVVTDIGDSRPVIAKHSDDEWTPWANSIHLTLDGEPTRARPRLASGSGGSSENWLPFGIDDGDRVIPLAYTTGPGGKGFRATAALESRVEIQAPADLPPEADIAVYISQGNKTVHRAVVKAASITRFYAPVGEIAVQCSMSRDGGLADRYDDGDHPRNFMYDGFWTQKTTTERGRIARLVPTFKSE